jgi:translation initiation factor 2B subunit (eIF-2B alpha/beta/delta family)
MNKKNQKKEENLWKKKKFDKIVKNIKEIKIQGATNIAKKALEAYFLLPTKKSKEILLKSRPTEPMMENVLNLAEKKVPKEQIILHFDESQKEINKKIFEMIKKEDIIFTHCHSTNVIKSLIFTKKKGKIFEVYNTETRPLMQGRKTAKELRRAGIKTTLFVDSALGIALTKEQNTKKVDKVFIGADALLKEGIINKVGSEVIANIAQDNKIPVYIVADSWKFTNKKIPLENRKLNEIWDRAPKKIKIKNPSFEFVDKKYISGIVSEFGLMGYNEFVRKIRS